MTDSKVQDSTIKEREDQPPEANPEQGQRKAVDLNLLFPGKEYDLNLLFPDEETRKLLYELRRNKRDIERFIKNLHVEEE